MKIDVRILATRLDNHGGGEIDPGRDRATGGSSRREKPRACCDIKKPRAFLHTQGVEQRGI
jgi:hypothetical protein